MKRVWLRVFLGVVAVMGAPWADSSVRADDLCPYPGVDAGCERQSDSPSWEELRAYGECHWYRDEEFRQEDVCEIIPDEPTPDQLVTSLPETGAAEGASEPAMELVPPSAVVGSTECWYDGETDAYYDHKFDGAEVATNEEATTDEASACVEQACPEEAYAESDCDEPALESSEIADVATEEAWGGDEGCAYDEYADSEWEDDSDGDDSYCQDDAYQSEEVPYVEPTYAEPGEPVRVWDATDVEVAEGEESDEAVPPAPNSELVEVDTEVILSVARTLDRVGVTLQCLSLYLTEVAAAKTADHQGPTFHR